MGIPERCSMRTPDKDWRLPVCAGLGIGIAVFFIPELFGLNHFGILGTVLMAVAGFLAGLVAYSFLFMRTS